MKLSINATTVICFVADVLFLFSMWYAIYYGMNSKVENFFEFLGMVSIVLAIALHIVFAFDAEGARYFYQRSVLARYWDYLLWAAFVLFNVWIGKTFMAFVLFLLCFSAFIIIEDKAEKMWAEDDPANSPGS